jgi:hypothetical protein
VQGAEHKDLGRDLTKSMWGPCSIQALLSAPNPDDPLAENVAKHWKDNEAEAVATGELRARMHLVLLVSALFWSWCCSMRQYEDSRVAPS